MQYLDSVVPSVEDMFDMIEEAIYYIIYNDQSDNQDVDKLIYLTSNSYGHKMYSHENSYVVSYLTQDNMLNRVLRELYEDTRCQVRQSTLCSVLPGVYYNFVCRSRKKDDADEILSGTYHEKVRSNVTRVRSPRFTSATRKILTNRMVEAEKRKRIQRQYYASNLYKDHRRKQNAELMRTSRTGQKVAGIGIIPARIQRRRQTIASSIVKAQYEKQAMLPTNKQYARKTATRNRSIAKLQKELDDLNRTEKQIEDNYQDFIDNDNIHRYAARDAPDGNYIKIKGQWVLRTKKTAKMPHTSPKRRSPLQY